MRAKNPRLIEQRLKYFFEFVGLNQCVPLQSGMPPSLESDECHGLSIRAR